MKVFEIEAPPVSLNSFLALQESGSAPSLKDIESSAPRPSNDSVHDAPMRLEAALLREAAPALGAPELLGHSALVPDMAVQVEFVFVILAAIRALRFVTRAAERLNDSVRVKEIAFRKTSW